jgi:hypothetical protein
MTTQPQPSAKSNALDLDSLPSAKVSTLSQEDEKLLKRFEEIDVQSIERLSDAGKRLVEWSTAAIGVFFAALALISNPEVLAIFQSQRPKILGTAAVVFYLLALAVGFFASIPYRYQHSTSNLTLMAKRLESIFTAKYRLIVAGSLLFALGTAALGGLIITALLAI